MHQERRLLPRIGATGVLLSTLLALILLLGTACGDDDAAATAEPPFTLPTNLPSPEAVIDDTTGSEATAATSSNYWPGPKTWAPEDVSELGKSNPGTGGSAVFPGA